MNTKVNFVQIIVIEDDTLRLSSIEQTQLANPNCPNIAMILRLKTSIFMLYKDEIYVLHYIGWEQVGPGVCSDPAGIIRTFKYRKIPITDDLMSMFTVQL